MIHQIHPIYVSFALPEQNLAAITQYRAAGTLRVEAVVPQAPGVRQQGALTFVNNTVDMTTGTSRVESDSGRVQGLFIQGQGQGCGGSAPAPGAPAPGIPSLIPTKPKQNQ